ncbi:ribosome modulation factor [Xenorhabdus mauleonii]|uniref:Ribosome modulation factor n=1 Tax=Xenorhabdus mauleonii TaxID=351675 RepID=A0A1I3HZ73_9GAMM|nr:ribosome modulation factor [Xenorhabdus mauleonii]PHM40216.1 ribosome modulation factor [Xenorhabdus mauleonii]SFI40942.1 ribosome modulation factor [Xenorhabdus mauleonii]
MKRQKRDRLARALSRGYQAGILGRSWENCPYQSLDARSYWLGGWRQARAARA